MPPVPPRRRRARPVADAPIDALLLRSEDLTRGWLIALLEHAPLAAAPGILNADLTTDGPRLCDAALRAIADDRDLHRLQAGGALRPLAARTGQLAAASSPADAAAAVDMLMAIVWAALREELRAPDADLISELSERIGVIGEVLREAALEGPAALQGRPAALGERPAGLAGRPAGLAERPAALSEPRAALGERPAVAEAANGSEAPPHPPELRVWPGGAAEARAEPGGALWVAALEDEIRRSAGMPLALLLAELEDADRVRAVEPRPEAAATFNRFTAAVRGATRRQDILVCETDERAWIIARDTGRPGARALALRVAEAVRSAAPWRGVPLTASIGVAVLGEDGRTAAELMEGAEEARFAAAASGVDVAGPPPDEN